MTAKAQLNQETARRMEGRAGAWVKRLPYLPKWLVLGGIIGVIAGLGAIVFYEALTLATHFFLGFLAGYHPPAPAGEGGGAGDAGFACPWAIPLAAVLGALIGGFLVFTWAPEAAVHKNPRGIRVRAVVIKIVASALTLGSCGSGGREGPTAQISAGFGSLLARVLDLSPEDGRIAVSVGVGSGIGAPNEPWSFGEDVYQIIRQWLALRERLRPAIMGAMRQAHDEGLPPMRPLFLNFPRDEAAWDIDDQFLLGDGILVAPVVTAGATERRVYLPGGQDWHDAWTGERVRDSRAPGGQWVTAPAALHRIPVYVTSHSRLDPFRGMGF